MKKKILLIANEPILPLTSGSRLRTWNFIQSLYGQYELYAVQPYQDLSLLSHQKETEKYFKKVWSVGRPKGKMKTTRWQRVKNMLRSIPWEIADEYNQELEKTLDDIFKTMDFDFVLARYIYQGHYLSKVEKKSRATFIIDVDDIETRKLEGLMEVEGYKNGYDRLRQRMNLGIFENFHKAHLRNMDWAIVCSQADKDYLIKKGWAKSVMVIPNALDANKYQLPPLNLKEKTILFPGTLNYGPNVDAIVWFAKEVFPLIRAKDPQMKLSIVGRAPCPEVKALQNKKDIFVFGDVPDILSYYVKAGIVVTPIRFAGGTRIKIIEAGFCRRPVVSTTIGAEGLNLTNRKHCLIADSKEAFAQACLEVMNNEPLAQSLAEANYQYMKENYDIISVSQKLAEVIK